MDRERQRPRTSTIPPVQTIPFIAFARDLLKSHGFDPKASGDYGSGRRRSAWPMAQALQIAGQLPGGLTRSNLIVAMRSMDMTNPMCSRA